MTQYLRSLIARLVGLTSPQLMIVTDESNEDDLVALRDVLRRYVETGDTRSVLIALPARASLLQLVDGRWATLREPIDEPMPDARRRPRPLAP